MLVGISVLAAVSSIAHGQRAPMLPARLTNAEFRGLITRLSEPAGIFPADNFTSNEATLGTIIPKLAPVGINGEAYIGVGPEQNFSYIAALRPRIAFIVYIRRQAAMQHLMYKALFELAADRAEFVSLLFARPRPPGLESTHSIEQIWRAFWPVDRDSALAVRSEARIIDRITRTHGIPLDTTDLAMLRYVYGMFVHVGPTLDYAATDARASERTPPFAPNTILPSLLVGDARSGAPIPDADVGYSTSAFNATRATNSDGLVHLPAVPSGTAFTIHITRSGYDTVRLGVKTFDVAVPERVVLLKRSASCRPDPAKPAVCTFVPASAPAARGPAGARGRAATTSQASRGSLGSPPTATQPSVGSGGAIQYGFATLTTLGDVSFLASEANYQTVKDLHDRNLILPIVGDFAGSRALRGVGTYLRHHGATVGAFYASNVEVVLDRTGGVAKFLDNLATLPVTPTSMLIRNGTTLCPITALTAAHKARRIERAGTGAGCAAAMTRLTLARPLRDLIARRSARRS